VPRALLQAESGTALGADISIDKQVPWGAGMGGGSSDAASTLLALNRLWNLDWPRPRLMALGLTLGADVPFFIGGATPSSRASASSSRQLPVPPTWLGVLKPAVAIETRAIFGSPLLVEIPMLLYLRAFLQTRPVVFAVCSESEGFGRNDLQPPAEAHCAEV
jgi:4-diphosphocytidyl-2-C-methyl-D-erythritol kinase